MAVFTAIGAAIFGAGTFLAGVTAATLQVVSGIAVNLLAKSMQGEPQAARFGVQGKVQTGEDTPRSIGFGWSCTAGSKVYQNEWGNGGVMSTRVLALYDYPVRELIKVFIDEVAITLDKNRLHAQYGWPVQEYRVGGTDHLWVKFYDGTQLTADSFLVNTVASTDRPYSPDRVGAGIAYAIVTTRAPARNDGGDKPLFNGFPQFKFETHGARLYDPSHDSSVGGVGAQRYSDVSTWGGDGDFLPPVQLYNLMRGIRFNGQWLYGLQALSSARLPTESWIKAINAARAQITTGDVTEPYFRSGGEIQIAAPIVTAVEALLTSCNGRLVEAGGTYKLYVGVPEAPNFRFTDGDIISTEEQSFSPFFPLSDTVNGISASYPNPNESWSTKKAPALLRPDLEVKDGNRRLMASVSLDLVPYHIQVQRLMQWALDEAMRARRHTFVLGPEFRVLEPGDCVEWTSERNQYKSKWFRVDGIVYKSNLDCIVDLTEVDPSDYDWDGSVNFRPIINNPIELVGPSPLPMTGWQVLPDVYRDVEGNARRPAIVVYYDAGMAGVDRVRVQVRLRLVGQDTSDLSALVLDSDAQPYGAPWRNILVGQFLPNTEYEVRGIFIRIGGAPSEWSGWLAVTTPDVKLVGGLDFDPYDGVIGFDQLDDDLMQYQDWLGNSSRSLRNKVEANAVVSAAQDLATTLVLSTIRHEIGVVDGENRAQWTEELTLVTDEQYSIANRVQVLSTTFNNATSEWYEQVLLLNDADNALAQGITTLSASFDSSQAILQSQLTALAAEDMALLEMLDTLHIEIGDDIATVASAFQSEISNINGKTEALANAFTDLSAGNGADLTTAKFKMSVSSGPAGYSRIGMQTRTAGTGPDVWRGAGFYLDTPNDVSKPSRVVIEADQFVVIAGGNLTNPLVFDAGGLRVGDALVRNSSIGDAEIDAAKIKNAAIKTAHIGNAQIDTLRIAEGGVSTVYSVVESAEAAIPNEIGLFTSILSITVPVSYGGVYIHASVGLFWTDLSPFLSSMRYWTVELRKNGVTVAIQRMSPPFTSGYYSQSTSLFFEDSEPNSTNVYEVGVRRHGNSNVNGNANRENCAIMAVNNKR